MLEESLLIFSIVPSEVWSGFRPLRSINLDYQTGNDKTIALFDETYRGSSLNCNYVRPLSKKMSVSKLPQFHQHNQTAQTRSRLKSVQGFRCKSTELRLQIYASTKPRVIRFALAFVSAYLLRWSPLVDPPHEKSTTKNAQHSSFRCRACFFQDNQAAQQGTDAPEWLRTSLN